MPTKEQVMAAMNAIRAIADAIREAKRIPSGHLYQAVMGHMDLSKYESFIGRLIGAGLVRKERDELVWVG